MKNYKQYIIEMLEKITDRKYLKGYMITYVLFASRVAIKPPFFM